MAYSVYTIWVEFIIWFYIKFCVLDTEHRELLRKPKKHQHNQLQKSLESILSGL